MEINTQPQDNTFVSDVTEQEFEQKVLERSKEVPVLVDFWAPWCGPCKTLGPTLEKLASEGNGRFELVKLNVDENQTIAQAFRVQSIPMVKLFINGQVRDEFAGAYPEPEILKFLDHHLPSEVASEALQGLELIKSGNLTEALPVFQQTLEAEPKNAVALLGMAYYHMEQGELDKCREFVTRINEVELDKLTEKQELEQMLSGLKASLYLLECVQQGEQQGKPEAPDALETVFQKACQDALVAQFEPALEGFLQVVRKDRAFRDDGGRLGMLAVFDLLPKDSPLLSSYRFKLSSMLFS